MNRLLILLVGFLSAAAVCAQPATDDAVPARETGAEALREMRRAAAERPRRIIYNNDGNDAFKPFESTAEFLARRSSGLEDTPVDTIFYCTGWPGKYSHRSRFAEPFAGWIPSLHETGVDPLDLMIAFARQHEREIFWSLRVNDIHDGFGKYTHLISRWKLDHPNLLMAPSQTVFPYGRSWTAMDFSQQEVRDYLLSLIAEVLRNYDMDGIELDFTRHDIFFRNTMFGRSATLANIESMTSFMREVRRLADEDARQRGKPRLIAIRTADSVEYLMETGIDLVRWFDEDLVDLWIPGGFFQLVPTRESIALGQRHGVKVYRNLCQTRLPMQNAAAWRAEAHAAWNDGADGLYLYNFWETKTDQHQLLREMGDSTLLSNLPRQADYQEDMHQPISATRKWTPAENITAALSFVRDTPGRFLSPEILWQDYPFLIQGALHDVPADFPSLADAVKAAQPGDTIRLQSTHRETLHKLVIDKDLKIFSCDESQAIRRKGARLELTEGPDGLVIRNASVTLDGIEITMRENARGPAVEIDGASLVARNCTIRGLENAEHLHDLIHVTGWSDAESILFDRVVFEHPSPRGTMVRLDPAKVSTPKCRIVFRNCLMRGTGSEPMLNPAQAGFWELDHCTLINPDESTLAAGRSGSMMVFRNCILSAPTGKSTALDATNGFIVAQHNLIECPTPFSGHVEMAATNLLAPALLGNDFHPTENSPALRKALRFPVDPETAAPVIRDLHGNIRSSNADLGCVEAWNQAPIPHFSHPD